MGDSSCGDRLDVASSALSLSSTNVPHDPLMRERSTGVEGLAILDAAASSTDAKVADVPVTTRYSNAAGTPSWGAFDTAMDTATGEPTTVTQLHVCGSSPARGRCENAWLRSRFAV
jgi:hypothetical protein